MGRADEKKRNDDWIPVDETASNDASKPARKESDTRGWEPPPPTTSTPVAPHPTEKPAAPAPSPSQKHVSPEERAVWADPVLSPWAKDPTQPAAAPAAPSSQFLTPATTSCPRCHTRVVYARNGSPPWEAVCSNCGAKGRFWK